MFICIMQKYFQSGANEGEDTQLQIEWTNQHGCGGNEDDDPHKLNCNLVIQYMVQDYDGISQDGQWKGEGLGNGCVGFMLSVPFQLPIPMMIRNSRVFVTVQTQVPRTTTPHRMARPLQISSIGGQTVFPSTEDSMKPWSSMTTAPRGKGTQVSNRKKRLQF